MVFRRIGHETPRRKDSFRRFQTLFR
ncbi:hypothetical protein A2U01_0091419, partial [Trifolium medium]|nr:hypothetical protein [Trifolium medium]